MSNKMAENGTNEDLPLMSNVKDILISHYNFSFKCNFTSKLFDCCSLLFLKPVVEDSECQHSQSGLVAQTDQFNSVPSMDCESDNIPENGSPNSTGFVLVLDCHQIAVKAVAGLSDNLHCAKFSELDPFMFEICDPLSFSVCDWSLRIWKDANTCVHCFPRVICISYETVPSCPSLLWVEDQNGKPSVFSYGSALNNRALFPCQEPPVAMATWEAAVSVPKPALVLMSGDTEPLVSHTESVTHFYYSTKKVLPLSTLCLAVGFWEEYRVVFELKNQPKCRIFACSKLLEKSVQEFSEYIPHCLEKSEELLGPYPFPRIDFLIVPPTFGSLGMASPNIIFLSQSLLAGDRSLCSRVSHEVAHGWFGLSIGALDWTEEWLSEGFATFIEDILHTKTTKNPHPEEYMELKSLIRKKTLLDEVENTKEDLQILRPSLGTVQKDWVDGMSTTVLKNGQNPLKSFIQVHYIKGYFLLRHLSNIVGMDAFIGFLQMYVKKFEGQLLTSLEFFNFFFESFPASKNVLSIENIYDSWLHNSEVTKEIKGLVPSSENQLIKTVSAETKKWKRLNAQFSKRKSKKRKCSLENISTLTSEQLVMLLENLLSERKLSSYTLEGLNKRYNLNESNAEVQHRWFELAVKWRHKSQYEALKGFLINHLAMGVYLYGELLYSEDPTQRRIAEECYTLLKDQMEPNYRSTLDGMLQDVTTE